MNYRADAPLIVQGDGTVLLEVNSPDYEAARDHLSRFAELEKSPEYIHTYRVSSLSLWNAAAAGLDAEEIVGGLEEYAKYPLPDNVVFEIRDAIRRYGRIRLTRDPYNSERLRLVTDEPLLLVELERNRYLKPYILDRVGPHTLQVPAARRGHVKQALVKAGFPAEDLVGYVPGSPLAFHLREVTQAEGDPFVIRSYQQDAAEIFWANGSDAGGAGVVVLPCGAGKTIVGMLAMNMVQSHTLILTPSTVAARQWREELLDKTTIPEEMIGEYTGQRKEIKPVTVTTYQILTHRKRGTDDTLPLDQQFPHFDLLNSGEWGLIIYDEVHLLPAPVFRMTAELQARRRLGLTATLVREDGREEDVFSLIGPKKYDVPWHDLERQGWIAPAVCYEIRVGMPEAERLEYIMAEQRQKYRVAADNTVKLDILDELLDYHRDDRVLVIGMYLDQLEYIARRYDFPIITGKTSVKEREELYEKFRTGEISTLVVSKVANFSVDLPDANVAIQISGTFGSRQEEAQRLGRILRPKHDGSQAYFYSIVTKETVDQDYSANRQRFLTEQGYRYLILYGEEIPGALAHTQRTA